VTPPAGLAYSLNPAIYTKGTTIPANTPSASGGAVVSYAVSPTLPPGLNLNTTTGVITGTPSTVVAAANYTVTAANSGGSTPTNLNITVNDAPPSGGSRTVSGTVTYDRVPATYSVTTQTGSLDFAQSSPRPARNATVQVMSGTNVLASTTTDATGHYTLSFTQTGSGALALAVLAQTTAPAILVKDNTDGAIWGIGAALDANATTLDLRATHGWTGSAFDPAKRTAAPFAILDSMYTAARAFLDVRPVAFPSLVVNWSPSNVPQAGDPAQGQIGTSHFSPSQNEIFILGKDGVDTDEYDSHVIVHEWGHFFEANLSRSDSPGGPHGPGDVLDPRLAFGEGYGNAIAAMVLPETMYVDTKWAGPGGTLNAFGFDAETPPVPTDDPTPSAFSEATVLRLLYDLFDGGTAEPFDQVGVGLGVIYDVLVGPERTTAALTTIGSFVAALKAQPGVSGAAVDALLAHYGIGPISSEWGDGDAALRDMYVDVPSLPAATTVALGGGVESNKWEQNQYFVVTGSGTQVSVSATSTEDVGLVVYKAGQKVTVADRTTSGPETVSFPTVAGGKYVISLVGFATTSGNYAVNMSFTSP